MLQSGFKLSSFFVWCTELLLCKYTPFLCIKSHTKYIMLSPSSLRIEMFTGCCKFVRDWMRSVTFISKENSLVIELWNTLWFVSLTVRVWTRNISCLLFWGQHYTAVCFNFVWASLYSQCCKNKLNLNSCCSVCRGIEYHEHNRTAGGQHFWMKVYLLRRRGSMTRWRHIVEHRVLDQLIDLLSYHIYVIIIKIL